jgi:hypothetical protein
MTDLVLQTPSRSSLDALLTACGLLTESLRGLRPVAGLSIDYFGPVVSTPAILSHSEFPPVVLTPAVFLPGEYAALRFTGDDSEANATLLLMAVEASADLSVSEVPHRWYDNV